MSAAETRKKAVKSPQTVKSRLSSDLIVLKVAGEACEIRQLKNKSGQQHIEGVCDRHSTNRGSIISNEASGNNKIDNLSTKDD